MSSKSDLEDGLDDCDYDLDIGNEDEEALLADDFEGADHYACEQPSEDVLDLLAENDLEAELTSDVPKQYESAGTAFNRSDEDGLAANQEDDNHDEFVSSRHEDESFAALHEVESDEEEKDGSIRDRFKSERSQAPAPTGVIPDSLESVTQRMPATEQPRDRRNNRRGGGGGGWRGGRPMGHIRPSFRPPFQQTQRGNQRGGNFRARHPQRGGGGGNGTPGHVAPSKKILINPHFQGAVQPIPGSGRLVWDPAVNAADPPPLQNNMYQPPPLDQYQHQRPEEADPWAYGPKPSPWLDGYQPGAEVGGPSQGYQPYPHPQEPHYQQPAPFGGQQFAPPSYQQHPRMDMQQQRDHMRFMDMQQLAEQKRQEEHQRELEYRRQQQQQQQQQEYELMKQREEEERMREQERIQEQQRIQQERIREQQRIQNERIQHERMMKERLEQERLEQQRLDEAMGPIHNFQRQVVYRGQETFEQHHSLRGIQEALVRPFAVQQTRFAAQPSANAGFHPPHDIAAPAFHGPGVSNQSHLGRQPQPLFSQPPPMLIHKPPPPHNQGPPMRGKAPPFPDPSQAYHDHSPPYRAQPQPLQNLTPPFANKVPTFRNQAPTLRHQQPALQHQAPSTKVHQRITSVLQQAPPSRQQIRPVQQNVRQLAAPTRQQVPPKQAAPVIEQTVTMRKPPIVRQLVPVPKKGPPEDLLAPIALQILEGRAQGGNVRQPFAASKQQAAWRQQSAPARQQAAAGRQQLVPVRQQSAAVRQQVTVVRTAVPAARQAAVKRQNAAIALAEEMKKAKVEPAPPKPQQVQEEEEEEDDDMREYRAQIAKQARLREAVINAKEGRRMLAAQQRALEEGSAMPLVGEAIATIVNRNPIEPSAAASAAPSIQRRVYSTAQGGVARR